MEPTTPIEVSERRIPELLEAMSKTGFQGRKLGEAYEIWCKMLEEKEITIFFGLSGAMIPAGMGKIISWFIEKRFVDVVVSTGANIYHDIFEALGFKHYIGSEVVDDAALFEMGINRIYNVFVKEEDFRKVDEFVIRVIEEIDGVLSSREFIEELAKRLPEGKSFLVSALKSGVPVFCPAIADSSIGIAAYLARKRSVIIDTMKDVEELAEIVANSKKTGVIYVGGGVPKNFIQQAEVAARLKGYYVKGHEYAIQITTDVPNFGGLSGCSLEESISWGKISKESKRVQVNVDATIALPILAHGLIGKRRKAIPTFWKRGVVSYESRID